MTLRYIETDGETCRFTYIPNEEVRVKIPAEYAGNLSIYNLTMKVYCYLVDNGEEFTRPLRGKVYITPDKVYHLDLFTNTQMELRETCSIQASYTEGQGVFIWGEA